MRQIIDAEAPPVSLINAAQLPNSNGGGGQQKPTKGTVKAQPIKVALLPHQLAAVQKLRARSVSGAVGGVGRFLGDEMRVGKTPTAIALDQDDRDYFDRKQRGNNCTLIACPKSVLSVWEQWPELMGVHRSQIVVVDLPSKTKIKQVLGQIAANKRRADAPAMYVIVNWDSVKLLQQQLIKAGPWFHCIGDEIHRIKDYNLERSKAWKRIKCKVKTGLSGTPADNKPEDIWSALNWLYPQKYSSFWAFAHRVCLVSVNRKTGYEYIDGVNPKALPEFHQEISSFYMRRRLHDVAEYLPRVQRQTIYVDMGKKQRRDYDQLAQRAFVDLEVDAGGTVTIITPSQVEWLVRAQQLAIGVCTVDDEGRPVLTDKPKSPKINFIEDWLDDNAGESLVVFAQYRATVARIRERLQGKYRVVSITGQDSAKERAEAIEEFQDGKSSVFVGTIGACREGIDLSRANTGIFVDRNWNPSWNEQAESRILNLGSTDPKTWFYLESRDSVDQYRTKRIDKKGADVSAMVNPT